METSAIHSEDELHAGKDMADPAKLKAVIANLEQDLQETENDREELLLQAATTRSVCSLLSNKLQEITDEMDEQKGYRTHGSMELQQRSKVLEEELAATCAEKEEVTARLAAFEPQESSTRPSPNKSANTTAALRLNEVQARLDHHLTDQRLLRDHIAFLEAGTHAILKERCSTATAVEENNTALKQVLVQKVLCRRREVALSEERLQWLQQAFQMLYGQSEEEDVFTAADFP